MVVADLRAGAVGGLVPRAGVVDRDPGRLRSPARSTSRASSRKRSWPSISRRMTCRLEMATPIARSCVTKRDGDLALMILGQHVAAQFRPEVAIHPARQGATTSRPLASASARGDSARPQVRSTRSCTTKSG